MNCVSATSTEGLHGGLVKEFMNALPEKDVHVEGFMGFWAIRIWALWTATEKLRGDNYSCGVLP